MTEIIPKVPATVREAWKSAADTLRLPFWDWASKKVRPDNSTQPPTTKLIYDVPLIAKYPEIDVVDYQKADAGITVKIENPMYKYTIPGTAQMGSYGINDVQANTDDGGFRTIPVRPSFHQLYLWKLTCY
jgi:tyrosinase